MEIDLVELLSDAAGVAADIGSGIALFIDEMQDVQPDDVSAICAACHELSQQGAPLIVVGAGLPHLPAVLSASKSYSERLFRYLRIDRLDREAADHALLAPAEREDVDVRAGRTGRPVRRGRRVPVLRPGLRQGHLGRRRLLPHHRGRRRDGRPGRRGRARGRLLRLPLRPRHPRRARVHARDGRARRTERRRGRHVGGGRLPRPQARVPLPGPRLADQEGPGLLGRARARSPSPSRTSAATCCATPTDEERRCRPGCEAGLWGLLGGGALVLGALVAWFTPVPRDVVAAVMAFGAGVLISAVAFDLMQEAESQRWAPRDGGRLRRRRPGLPRRPTLASPGAAPTRASAPATSSLRVRAGRQRHRRSRWARCSTASRSPIVLGARAASAAAAVSLTVLAAVFISNVPEGLSSAAGMKRSGRSATYVFGVWGGIAVTSGAGRRSWATCSLGDASPGVDRGDHRGRPPARSSP